MRQECLSHIASGGFSRDPVPRPKTLEKPAQTHQNVLKIDLKNCH